MKIKRLLANILLITLILNSTVAFANSRTVAEQYGYDDARKYVLQEYRRGADGSEIPIKPNFPSDKEIEDDYEYELSRLTQRNIERFIKEYLIGYEEGYKGIREQLFGSEGEGSVPEVELNYAKSLGESMGEIYGYDDYYNNVKSNWSKSIPSNSKVTSMFNLNMETSQYRSGFLAEFRTYFKKAYEEAYEYALLNIKDVIIGSAVTNGKELGHVLGSIYGDKDYFEGKSNNYKRDIPSDNSIVRDYLLNRTLDEYRAGFINGFKLGYEEGYNDAYYNSFKGAVESGRHAGELKGELMATKDYIENKAMDWSRHKLPSSSMTNEYGLIYLSNVYRDSFLNSFWVGFAEKYEEVYKGLINEQVSEKIAYGIVPISGGRISSPDNSIAVEIHKGTFYNDIALSIERVLGDGYGVDESRYILASDIYNIQLSNPSQNMNNSNQISISMEYYGKNDGGIYKWVDNKWCYVSSLIGADLTVININPNTLRQGDNLYRILIDKNYDILTDIRSHWAKEEINTLVRRSIITGYPDYTFKPDRNINRAEFLALLSRVYHWQLPKSTKNINSFTDYESFGAATQLISYGIDAGYILGYDDNTFRANQAISYKEVEIIMGRVLNDSSFKWHDTSAKMLYDKQIRSKGYNNMDNKITRAEVAYMLYILNEWRY
ncbi:MAG: S-layer homology domain-containing protein [Tissierella sp.]|nr:S-layer homology domain-containing protein [Tissierella sp.]